MLPERAAPEPVAAIAAVPATTPFVAPEELARTAGLRDLLRLGANESAFGPAPAAIAAIGREAARTSWYGDPESRELRDALARRHGCAVENIVVASGIDELLGLAVRGYLGAGNVAVTTLGSYPTFNYHVVGFGSRIDAVPYASDGCVQLDALAGRCRATGARIVYLANPDNPSGSFAAAARVSKLAADLPDDALLLLDEAYADFVPAGELLAGAIDPRVIRLRTFSKAFGLAGARIGYALAAPEVVATFQKIRLHYGVNRPAQIAALASLGERAFVDGVIAEVNRGRDEYAALGRRLGLPTLPSLTNFVLFDIATRERAERLLDELLTRGVFIRKPGAPPLDRCIRVTVGTADERARFALILAEALGDLDTKR